MGLFRLFNMWLSNLGLILIESVCLFGIMWVECDKFIMLLKGVSNVKCLLKLIILFC